MSPDNEEEDYVCKSCGQEWDGEATAFYIEGRCSNCGAAGSAHKVKADEDNPLTRQGEYDQ